MKVEARALGIYGGTVRRPLSTPDRRYLPGEEIAPEDAATWNPANRVGLERSGYVFWYTSPRGTDPAAPLDGVSISVRLPDGTVVPATIETGDGGLVAVVGPANESAPAPAATRGRKN